MCNFQVLDFKFNFFVIIERVSLVKLQVEA